MINETVYQNLIDRLCTIELDGKTKITISNAGDKTTKQRGYQWRLYLDISKSGVGGERNDTAEGVHVDCKWRFALPIFMRDDDFFQELYLAFKNKYETDSERMRWFIANQVHTEQFNTSQMAEYLTMLINFYAPMGVQLSDPKDYGLKKGKL
jgi:hypothetical protein